MKNAWFLILGCSVLFLAFSGLAGATEGRPCIPEPTDELIDYGDLIICDNAVGGDLDVFRFSGIDGEVVTVQATAASGANPCITVRRPDGTILASGCDYDRIKRFIVSLDQIGTHTLAISERLDRQMDYTLSLERIAPPSPSASPICPGCNISDTIDPAGDVDLFFFDGNAGDTVLFQAAWQNGGTPCVWLYRPDGTHLASDCDAAIAVIAPLLDQTGTHSLIIRENGGHETMDYNLSYSCIGICPDTPRIACDIDMSQPSYIDGDMLTISTMRLANSGADPLPIELKVWVRIPAGQLISLWNLGADGSFILPPGFDQTFGPFELVTVTPDIPRGDYQSNCRLLEPPSGNSLTLDINPFEIQ